MSKLFFFIATRSSLVLCTALMSPQGTKQFSIVRCLSISIYLSMWSNSRFERPFNGSSQQLPFSILPFYSILWTEICWESVGIAVDNTLYMVLPSLGFSGSGLWGLFDDTDWWLACVLKTRVRFPYELSQWMTALEFWNGRLCLDGTRYSENTIKYRIPGNFYVVIFLRINE